MSLRRRALLLVASFLPLFALTVWLYPGVLPSYERSVLALANPLLSLSSKQFRYEVEEDGELLAYVRSRGGRWQPLFDRPYAPYTFFISLALLPALLLATPLSLGGRLRLLGIGLLLLYSIHVATLAGVLHVEGCRERLACRWLYGLLMTSGQFGAFAIWGLLTWSEWLPGDRAGLRNDDADDSDTSTGA